MTNFEEITASAEALDGFLAALNVPTGPWDEEFHRMFCDSCERENCDRKRCPHKDKRNSPLWWLTLGEKKNRVVMWAKRDGYRQAMEEFAGKIREARSERIKATGDKSFTHLEALLTELVEVLLPDEKCRVVMDYDPDADNVIFRAVGEKTAPTSETQERQGTSETVNTSERELLICRYESMVRRYERRLAKLKAGASPGDVIF